MLTSKYRNIKEGRTVLSSIIHRHHHKEISNIIMIYSRHHDC